jgi:Uma2 family endonuclease
MMSMGGPVVALVEQRMTLEEFLELPEEEPALEYIDGMVTQKVPPQGKHARLQPWLCARINAALEPKKLAMAFSELRTTYSGSSRVPGVAVYRWERIPKDANGEVANDFREPPDVAIEIISPGQRTNQLVRRCLWFIGHGVAVALLVDPDDKSVLIFRPDRIPIEAYGSDLIDLSDVLPGCGLQVDDIFSSLRL